MKTNLLSLLILTLLIFNINISIGQDNKKPLFVSSIEHGLVLQNPPTREYYNNLMDTADHIIYWKNDTIWIQFYKDQIFFNHKYFGKSEKGDTIRLNYDGKLEIIRPNKYNDGKNETASNEIVQFESYYNQVIKSPNLKTELCNGRVQITHLYKQQIKTLYEGRDLNRNDFTIKYANEIYFPYKELWASFFNKEGFVEWLNEYWDIIHNPNHNGIKLPFKVDFDSVYKITSEKIKLLIQKEPKGKWYLCYGTGGDMGGLNNGIMFANLITIGSKDDGKGFIFDLPHEINHQIYDEFNLEQDNLLRCFINEGLSCYLNYIYWDKKYSAAENIGFTNEEWEYSIENEAKIYDFAKDKLQSLDQDIKDKFHRWHYYIWENSPDRLAYFIGFRIVQAYVEKNGKDSWKEIYDLPLSEVISKSDYTKFITKNKDK